MTVGFFKVYALAVDASSSYADAMIPRVRLISNIERRYGEFDEKISSLAVLSVHYPAIGRLSELHKFQDRYARVDMQLLFKDWNF